MKRITRYLLPLMIVFSLLLTACAAPTPAAPQVVEKQVEVTRQVEVAKIERLFTTELAAASEESAASANELSRLAEELKSTVGRFTT